MEFQIKEILSRDGGLDKGREVGSQKEKYRWRYRQIRTKEEIQLDMDRDREKREQEINGQRRIQTGIQAERERESVRDQINIGQPQHLIP